MIIKEQRIEVMYINFDNIYCQQWIREFKNMKIGLSITLTIILCNFLPTGHVYAQEDNQAQLPPISPVSNLIDSKASSQSLVVPPISFVDVNSGRFGKLEIDLEDGQFLDTAVDKLHLVANKLDVQAGTLKSLNIEVKGGHVRDFIFDKLSMDTTGDLNFDSGIFLNHRLLQFSRPAQANISVLISQTSLNQFLNSPRTLERFSSSATRRAGAMIGLANLVGIKINQIGFNIQSANVKLARHNQFKLTVISKVGVGDLALNINAEIQGELTLQDGVLIIANPHLVTAGQEIPPELANILLKKINLIPALSQQSEDIHFNFNELKVSAGKQIQLHGIAYVSRLRFGSVKRQ